jgi:hypothetical protein
MSETTLQQQIDKRKIGRPRKGNEKLPKKKAEMLIAQGYTSPTDLAELVGCSTAVASRQISRYVKDVIGLEDYKKNRADIFAEKQKELVNALDASTIKKMQPRDLIIGIGVLGDKERLERGQSTANVANLHAIADRAIRAISSPETHQTADLEASASGNAVDK